MSAVFSTLPFDIALEGIMQSCTEEKLLHLGTAMDIVIDVFKLLEFSNENTIYIWTYSRTVGT